MTEAYTISLFGHRYIEDFVPVEEELKELVKKIIPKYETVFFLVGRDGDFDRIAASAIRRARKEVGHQWCNLIWVIPYETADYRDNYDEYMKYYDGIHDYDESYRVHYKAAHKVRNRCMIDESDLVICYVGTNKGGAYDAMRYAQRTGKKVINIF